MPYIVRITCTSGSEVVVQDPLDINAVCPSYPAEAVTGFDILESDASSELALDLDLPDLETQVPENSSHSSDNVGNPHSIDKADVGLSNVTNDVQIPLAEKGAPNGVPTLDASAKIPTSQLPTSGTEYKGSWNAATNSPALVDGVGANGDLYRVSFGGDQDLGSGLVTFSTGDTLIYNGQTSVWDHIPSDSSVQSVNLQTGLVVLDADDISDTATVNKFTTAGDVAKLGGIEPLATADQSDAEIASAYGNVVSVVSQALAEAGTSTSSVRWTPERIKQAIQALAGARELLHIQDQKPQNTEGGAFLSGAPRVRDLNTILTNEILGASLSSNQITLPAGSYYIEASAPASDVNEHKVHLYDVSNSLVLLLGTSEYSTISSVSTRSFVSGKITLPATTVLELRHQCAVTDSSDGFGESSPFGGNEVFSDIKIWTEN